MEDFRDIANAKVHTATAALSATYSAMNQSVALPNPVVESNLNSFAFAPNLYDAYFYHSDHLGSSNYISNNTGIVSQHTEYLPFGETFVDEHLNSHNTPFKFNAKEFDDETGNYYYGARYYNPKWSTWLSVDPLVEQTFEPYNYVGNNPIRFIDPTGMNKEEGGEDPPKKQNVNVVVLPKNIPKTDDAINNIKSSAENHLDENVLVLHVTGIDDLVRQLKENNVGSIGTLSNNAHGSYEDSSIKIGKELLKDKKDFKKLGEALKPFCTSDTNIVLQSCHAGGGKDMQTSAKNMKAVGDSSGANIFAPMTWGLGSKTLFNNGKGAINCIPEKYQYSTNRGNSIDFLGVYRKYDPNARCGSGSFTFIENNIRFQRNGSIAH